MNCMISRFRYIPFHSPVRTGVIGSTDRVASSCAATVCARAHVLNALPTVVLVRRLASRSGRRPRHRYRWPQNTPHPPLPAVEEHVHLI